MGVVHNFGIVHNSVRFFLGSAKMSKRPEVSIIYSNLYVARSQKIIFQTTANTG